MNKLVKGERYTCTTFRSGISRNGPWELFKVVDSRGKNEITVFPTNLPTEGYDNCDFIIRDILEIKTGMKQIKTGMKQRESDYKWFSQVSVAAVVDVVKSDINIDDEQFGDLDDIPWDTDNELPL